MKESPSGLKQHTLITLSFWGPRIWVQLSWVLWLHVCPSAAVITGLDLGGSASTLAHMAIRRTQVLMGCWTEGFSSLLAVGWTPSSVLCSMGLSMVQPTAWQPVFLRASKEESRRKSGTRISFGGSSLFHILFVRRKSPSPAHTPGGKHMRVCKPGARITRAISETAYHMGHNQ